MAITVGKFGSKHGLWDVSKNTHYTRGVSMGDVRSGDVQFGNSYAVNDRIEGMPEEFETVEHETDEKAMEAVEQHLQEAESYDDLENVISQNKKVVCEIEGEEKRQKNKEEIITEQVVTEISVHSPLLKQLELQAKWGERKLI